MAAADVSAILAAPMNTKNLLTAKILNAQESALLQDFITEPEAERQTFLEEVRTDDLDEPARLMGHRLSSLSTEYSWSSVNCVCV